MSFLRRFRGARRKGGADPRSGADPSTGSRSGSSAERVRLRSLALGSLFSRLVPGGAYEFLDLGPAIGSNVEFLSRYGRGVQVGDLWTTMNEFSTTSPARRVERSLETLVAGSGERAGIGYHVVLAWDLLNYLSPDELDTAAEMLARSLRPGGYLFAVVYYSAKMPAEPLRYTISDRETLTYKRPQNHRPAPRYPQRTLLHAFRNLELEHSYLLKSGIQEYLFVRE